MEQNRNVIIVRSEKSMGLAILLTFLFGPLGMFYSTVIGAIIMLVLGGILILVTFGVGALITWPISIIWTILAVNSYNKELRRG